MFYKMFGQSLFLAWKHAMCCDLFVFFFYRISYAVELIFLEAHESTAMNTLHQINKLV